MVSEEILLNSVDVFVLPGQGYSFTAEQFLTWGAQGPRLAQEGGAFPPHQCLHSRPSLCLLFP